MHPRAALSMIGVHIFICVSYAWFCIRPKNRREHLKYIHASQFSRYDKLCQNHEAKASDILAALAERSCLNFIDRKIIAVSAISWVLMALGFFRGDE